jgi:hypothetical protein
MFSASTTAAAKTSAVLVFMCFSLVLHVYTRNRGKLEQLNAGDNKLREGTAPETRAVIDSRAEAKRSRSR